MPMLIDLSLKWTIAALLAAVVTRRVRPSAAGAAYRMWLAVLLTPVWWAVGAWLLEPAVFVRARHSWIVASVPATTTQALGWIGLIYAAVAMVLMIRIAFGVVAVHRLTVSARPLGAEEQERLAGIIGPVARLVREGPLTLPVTAGFLSPVILLPSNWRTLPEESLTAILHHEAAHVRRHDCLAALVAGVAEALFWFHPVSWIAVSRVRWFAEMACDAEATRAIGDRAYAGALLTMASEWRTASRPRYALLAGAETNVAKRIHLLIDEMELGRRRRPLLGAAAIVVALVVAVSGVLRLGGLSAATEVPPHFHRHAH